MSSSPTEHSGVSDSLPKRLARRFLPDKVIGLLIHVRNGTLLQPHAMASFSQEGEDLLLLRILEDSEPGFYVDVGAHHPTRFSNTYLLYKRGWHGINIDATPGSMRNFNKIRPRDINLEVAIANSSTVQRLYIMSDPALNSLSAPLSRKRSENTEYEIAGYREVPTKPLREVLNEHVPRGVDIALMSIDTEGYDFEVLQSNDWSRYRPGLLLLEVLNASLQEVLDAPEVQYMGERGYRVHAKLHNTVLLIDDDDEG